MVGEGLWVTWILEDRQSNLVIRKKPDLSPIHFLKKKQKKISRDEATVLTAVAWLQMKDSGNYQWFRI